MKRPRIWWICDCCGRERRARFRPERCAFDRLGKHPPFRPMGPVFMQAASSGIEARSWGDRAHCGRELVHQTGMSPTSLGPMLYSMQTADEGQRNMPPPILEPGEGP